MEVTCKDPRSSKKAVFTYDCPPFELAKARVDGSLIPTADTRIRCDFLVTAKVLPEGPKWAYLVELKGNDIKYAIRQIFATIQYPEMQPYLADTRRKIGIIVFSGTTSAPKTKVQDLAKQIMKNHNVLFRQPKRDLIEVSVEKDAREFKLYT